MQENLNTPKIESDNLWPIIIKKFRSLDEGAIFHHKYNLRHPGAIFNITSEYIVDSLTEFVDFVSKNEFDSQRLFNGYRLVLYDFFKFYDSCFEIMACFCDAQSKWNLFIDRWLEKNNFTACENFKNKVGNDIRVLKLEYNRLKHTSNRINWLNQYSENVSSFGYYLEKSGQDGKSEPENLTDYPISLNRQIRHIYYCIFRISEALTTELDTVCKDQNLDFNPANIEIDSWKKWAVLFEKISQLPNLYFLVEVNKEAYLPKIKNRELVFNKEVIDKSLMKQYTNPIRVNMMTTGDGYTKTFSIPSMSMQIP